MKKQLMAFKPLIIQNKLNTGCLFGTSDASVNETENKTEAWLRPLKHLKWSHSKNCLVQAVPL